MRDTRALHRHHRQVVTVRCDGNWRSHYEVVYQYCKTHNIPMFMGLETAIAPVTEVGNDDPKKLTEAMVEEMIADPLVTLCSHSRNHKSLGYTLATSAEGSPNCANAAELYDEIVGSKNDLETKFGVEITGMIYPAHRIDMHGFDMLRYNGYKWGCSPKMTDEGDLAVSRRHAGYTMSMPAVWALPPFNPWTPFRITTDGTDAPHDQLANGDIAKYLRMSLNFCAWHNTFFHDTAATDVFTGGMCSTEDFTTIMDALRATDTLFLSMDEMVDLLMNPVSHWTHRVVDYADIDRWGFNLAVHGHLRHPKVNSVSGYTYYETLPAYWESGRLYQETRGWRINGINADTDFVFHQDGGPDSDIDGMECGYISVQNEAYTAFSHQIPLPRFGQRSTDGRVPIVVRFKARKGTSAANLQSTLVCGRLSDGFAHGLSVVNFTSHDAPGNTYVKNLGAIADDGEWHTYQVKWRAIGNADRLYVNLCPAAGDAGMHDISDLQIYVVKDDGFASIPEGLME
jgi:hypothetical protein